MYGSLLLTFSSKILHSTKAEAQREREREAKAQQAAEERRRQRQMRQQGSFVKRGAAADWPAVSHKRVADGGLPEPSTQVSSVYTTTNCILGVGAPHLLTFSYVASTTCDAFKLYQP